jgi:hypothetical protein
MAASANNNGKIDERFYELVRLPKNLAEQFRKWLAERPTGSFEIHAIDGVIKTATKRSMYRANETE